MELTVAFDICAFLLSSFCMFYELRKRRARSRQNSVYLLLVCNVLASAFFAIFANMIQIVPSFRIEENRSLLFLSLMIYFLLHNILPATYAMYIRIILGLDASRTRAKELRFFLPAAVSVAIVLLNVPFGWVFTLGEDMRFARAHMTYVLYALSVFYVGAALYYLLRYRVALQKRIMNSLYMYYVLALFGIIFQMLVPQAKVELFFEALSILGLMLVFEEDDALHDTVTGVFNNMAFRRDVTRLLATNQPFYCIDLRFLNMKFYARVMDVELFHMLLVHITDWLSDLRKRMSIYHFGDDFVLLIFNAEEEDIHTLIWNLRKKLDDPFVMEGVEAQFHSYISVVKAPEDIKELDDVLDLLEYEPDNKGSQVLVQYRESLNYVRREAAVERALRNAVVNRSFQVYYQPIYDCETGRIVSAEALVRLIDEELGNISPGEFIPIAERSALIVEIGNIVFEKVCRFLQEHRPEELGIEYTEVNLSVAQFMQSNLVERFAEILSKYGVPAERINLEITESVASDTTEPFMLAIRQLENMGFTFSMDDYGTGYSNISSILNVNFKNIKMDKSFLGQALDNRESASILRDTTHLIRHLGRNVLQEGVETREELNFVQEAGCNLIQGFYFSKPLPEADFLDYVRTFNHAA